MSPAVGRRAAARIAVIGGGVMGVWTALWLRRRGHDVTLIDQYGIGNVLASSGDETRVTRSGYGADDFYPRWQRRALSSWQTLEEPASRKLFTPTGVLWLVTDGGGQVEQSAATLERLGIPIERWSTEDVERRLPWIASRGVSWALYEPEGGVLAAREGVIAAGRRLLEEGGTVVRGRVLPPTSRSGRLLRVELASGSSFGADAFVFACGPWLPKVVPELDGFITVTRQEVVYVAPPPGDRRFDADLTPVWIDMAAIMYGLPSIDGRGFKVAPDRAGPVVDPDRLDRRISEEIVLAVREFLRARFPDLADQPVIEGRVCQYESTPDTHLLIDRLAGLENVWVVGGGSGHGFKHGPVIGEYVAALVTGDLEAASELAPPDRRFALPPARQHEGTPIGATLRHHSPADA